MRKVFLLYLIFNLNISYSNETYLDELSDIFSSLVNDYNSLSRKSGREGKDIMYLFDDDPSFNAYLVMGDIITIHKGVITNKLMTTESRVLLFCHELGHILGGSPVDGNSIEGESDYFASFHCMKKFYKLHPRYIKSELKLSKSVQDKCTESFKSKEKKDICLNIIEATTRLTKVVHNVKVGNDLCYEIYGYREIEKTYDKCLEFTANGYTFDEVHSLLDEASDCKKVNMHNSKDIKVCEYTYSLFLKHFKKTGQEPTDIEKVYLKSKIIPSIHSPDQTVVSEHVMEGYPSIQCRLDIFVAGALCNKPVKGLPDLNFNSISTCTRLNGDKVGLRPRCYYSPEKSDLIWSVEKNRLDIAKSLIKNNKSILNQEDYIAPFVKKINESGIKEFIEFIDDVLKTGN